MRPHARERHDPETITATATLIHKVRPGWQVPGIVAAMQANPLPTLALVRAALAAASDPATAGWRTPALLRDVGTVPGEGHDDDRQSSSTTATTDPRGLALARHRALCGDPSCPWQPEPVDVLAARNAAGKTAVRQRLDDVKRARLASRQTREGDDSDDGSSSRGDGQPAPVVPPSGA